MCKHPLCSPPPGCAHCTHCTQGAPSTTGSGSLFLPDGAVGVFDLPSTWAVIQRSQGLQSPAPMIDSETFIVMDLMDRGTLAAAIRQGAFVDPATGGVRAVRCRGGRRGWLTVLLMLLLRVHGGGLVE